MKYFIFSDKLSIASELVGFAKSKEAEAVVFAFNENQANELAKSGASKVILVTGPSARPEDYASGLAEFLLKECPDCVLVSATTRMRDFAASLAGNLGWPMVNDAMEINLEEGSFVTKKMMYGGATVRTESFAKGVVIIVPEGKYEACEAGEAAVESVAVAADSRVKYIGTEEIKASGSNLASAERVVGIGLGLGKTEGLEEVHKLMDALDADIASSRPAAEEKHWVESERYVGISNLNISPKLYVALGISGQVQHVVGVRDAKIIVAVNTDENANIFRYADYGIVADMYEFIPEMIKAL